MIRFNFKIELPIRRWGTIWTFSGSTPFPNKYWDFDFFRSADVVSFDFSWKTRTDHAGFNVDIGLFGYNANFVFYDSRHWDNENNCYEV